MRQVSHGQDNSFLCLWQIHLARFPPPIPVLPPVPSDWLPKVVGPSWLCRVRSEAFVWLCSGGQNPWGAGAGVGMIIAHLLCSQSKISSPLSFLSPLPCPLHKGPICRSHVIFAVLFAQCFGGYSPPHAHRSGCFALAEAFSSFHLN